MKKSLSKTLLLALSLSLILLLPFIAFSDSDDDEGEDHEWHSNLRHGYSKHLSPAVDPLYQQECGACHFAYQAGLLPKASWEKIMDGLDQHFEEDASLSSEHASAIQEYLYANSAENSSARFSKRILRSLEGATPLRISDIPFFKHEHREVGTRVLARKSIRSWANCSACHTTAKRGIYDEKYIQIPR